jgi:acetoacetyl-CoA synthetase
MTLIQGQVVWTPSERERLEPQLARYLAWLQEERGIAFADYDAVFRWSIEDLEAFWASVWDYYGIRAHTPFERVLGAREMPGAEWFPGATLNYAEHMLGGDDDQGSVAVVAH